MGTINKNGGKDESKGERTAIPWKASTGPLQSDAEIVRKGKDPLKIVELASVHIYLPDPMGANVYPDGEVVKGYAEKLAAIENPNTPTIFLLYLYSYPRKGNKNFKMEEDVPVGPGLNVSEAPYVTDEIRGAAAYALSTERNWKLTGWEEENLEATVKKMVLSALEKARDEHFIKAIGGVLRNDDNATFNRITNTVIGIRNRE